jgi:hypothetical protein
VRRVLRTANPESRAVASEISRGAPPYQYSPRKDPDMLNVRSTYVSDFTPIPGNFICVLLSATERYHCATERLSATIRAPPRIETARLRTGRAVGHTVRPWPDATCCDGQCQGPQDAPSRKWPRSRAWAMQPFMLTWYEHDTRGGSVPDHRTSRRAGTTRGRPSADHLGNFWLS